MRHNLITVAFPMQNSPPDQLIEAYRSFPQQFSSVVLGTVSEAGVPQASYAPCVTDPEHNLYVFVSGLSTHTQNLSATGIVSALFIEDESKTQQMFARKRLSYDCTATLLDRDCERWAAIAQQFEDSFGDIVGVMKSLSDFRIFKLTPQSGRFVIGFGAAYDIDPEDFSNLIHQGPS